MERNQGVDVTCLVRLTPREVKKSLKSLTVSLLGL